MSNLLIKIFINDYQNLKDKNVRKKYGELGGFVGIFSNIILFLIKLILGIFINSVSIIADSFNNLLDSLSSIITIVGFKLASKPADKEHPFGHGRMEYISGLIISFIIIFIGLEFFKTSFIKIFKPEELSFSYISIIILIITIFVKIWQSMFNMHIGKLINSHSLIATAVDSRNDVLVTLATVVSLLAFKIFNLNLDGYFGIFVSCFLIYSGINLAKETLSPLLGEALDEALAEKIKEIALGYEGVLGVHDILVHNYGPNKSIASLHIELPNNMNIAKSHEIIDEIENKIKEDLDIFITIHLDPVDLNDKRIGQFISYLKEIFANYEEKLDSHDHRIVDSENRTNFIFDLVIPYEFSKKNEKKLIEEIIEKFASVNKKYKCIINIEKSFIINNQKD